MKIQLEVSEENEGTESPYWLILDPMQMMKPDCHHLAHMITGPFFSREAAQNHLEGRRYEFSRRAVVYCASGYWSGQYHRALKKALAKRGKKNPPNYRLPGSCKWCPHFAKLADWGEGECQKYPKCGHSIEPDYVCDDFGRIEDVEEARTSNKEKI